MAKVILQHRGLFLEWNTVACAPSTPAMTRPAFEASWRERHGPDWMEGLDARLDRAARTGTSSADETPDDDVEGNELGPDGRALSFAEIAEVWFRHGHGADVAHVGPGGLLRQDAARIVDPDAWAVRDERGEDQSPELRRRIADSLLKADGIVALGLPRLTEEARASEVLAWREAMAELAARSSRHDRIDPHGKPADIVREVGDALDRLEAGLPPAPAHVAGLADILDAWSRNSPDPDWFAGDCLSAVLDDCGRAAVALRRAPDATEAGHWRRQALETAARIAEEDGAATTAARIRGLAESQ